MRKFVISDIHGNGDIYDTIMGYLDNISEVEEIELYINGDLIDRGLDSFRVLMDVKERIEGKGKIKIHYLAGNHEWMMHEALKARIPGYGIDHWTDWLQNGGEYIEGELDVLDNFEELCDYFKDFMGNLKIYHMFDETINKNPVLLVHAQAPNREILGQELKIKDHNKAVFDALWTRREKRGPSLLIPGEIIGYNRIGLDGLFTIKGHTRVRDYKKGFDIDQDENYINIDGGCASYAVGLFKYDRVPLIELKDNHFEIIVFNHNNEIVNGYYYDGNLSYMSKSDIDYKRQFLDSSLNGQAVVYQKEIMDILNGIKNT